MEIYEVLTINTEDVKKELVSVYGEIDKDISVSKIRINYITHLLINGLLSTACKKIINLDVFNTYIGMNDNKLYEELCSIGINTVFRRVDAILILISINTEHNLWDLVVNYGNDELILDLFNNHIIQGELLELALAVLKRCNRNELAKKISRNDLANDNSDFIIKEIKL